MDGNGGDALAGTYCLAQDFMAGTSSSAGYMRRYSTGRRRASALELSDFRAGQHHRPNTTNGVGLGWYVVKDGYSGTLLRIDMCTGDCETLLSSVVDAGGT
jgi:hypothetical protein